MMCIPAAQKILFVYFVTLVVFQKTLSCWNGWCGITEEILSIA